ncbi:C40 family peptidase [Streptomyces sp. LaPpAH-108]|uniref:C40 family peptidase n=1 Tax=Streptomyces sp. LaPpAH-108 TaxID=1155714 RepID=UPI000361894E|nr:NlpC/P60 family protein [Streptomyces sp. LaPpAH-108]
MGSGKRGLLAAAVTVVCAVTVLAGAGTAFASVPPDLSATPTASGAPAPAPSGSPAPGTTPGPAPSATPTPAPDKDLEKIRKRLDRLYREAAAATDAYNAAEEKADKQSARLDDLNERIAEGRKRLKRLKDQAGATARAQYRNGGLPPTARFLLSDDPQRFADSAAVILNGERATKKLLTEMTRTQKELRADSDDATARMEKLEADRADKAAAKKKIKKRIADAELVESRLEKKEKERLAELERQAAHAAQTAWLDSGALDGVSGKTSAEGKKAVAFATAQLGKPYVWGAEGPDSFDCSGLTSQAWAAAGHPIPRTSQEQWRRLPHVAVADMRPGDLIIYFGDATHVAMYAGDGKIIHAPRPGRTVTVTGAGTMPILGVVRPNG